MKTILEEQTKILLGEEYYDQQDFIKDCKTYIAALRAGRVQYRVTHVSQSGCSRNIHIQSFEGKMSGGYYRNYSMMLKVLGFRFDRPYGDIKVGGGGMDMLFATNYDIIHTFKRMGLITKKTCDVLAQKT